MLEQGAATALSAEERATVEALRAGEERAFLALVRQHHASMLRVASLYLSSAALAEEAVQEAWVGVLKGLDGFQGRSSLRAWIFGILANCAKSRAGREARSVPFSSLAREDDDDGPAVDPSRFNGPEHPRWAGNWAAPPQRWTDDQLLDHETARAARRAIEQLPARQREVITLRDVEGLDAAEACALLDLSEANQRVLLHRARSKVRAALEAHLRTETRP